MNTTQIDQRIKDLNAEQKNLEQAHNVLMQEHQKRTQEFQQQAVQNQTRYAQIQGALAELFQLKQNKGENNEPTDTGSGTATERTSDRIPGNPRRSRHHSGANIRD
jgi:hypothetical protein